MCSHSTYFKFLQISQFFDIFREFHDEPLEIRFWDIDSKDIKIKVQFPRNSILKFSPNFRNCVGCFPLKIVKCVYGGYLEMPQKACEGGIFHVRAMHIFPEMPQNRRYSFSVIFSFSNRSRVFFSKCPTFFSSFFLNAPFFPFSESDRKNGAFQEKRT